jgi:hypothetical protein
MIEAITECTLTSLGHHGLALLLVSAKSFSWYGRIDQHILSSLFGNHACALVSFKIILALQAIASSLAYLRMRSDVQIFVCMQEIILTAAS